MLGEMSLNFDIPVVSPCGSSLELNFDLNDDDYYKYIQDDYERVVDIFVNEPTKNQNMKEELLEDMISDLSDCTLPFEEGYNDEETDLSLICGPMASLEPDLLKVNGIDIDCLFDDLHNIKGDPEVQALSVDIKQEFNFSHLQSSSPRSEDSDMTIPCMESPPIPDIITSLEECLDHLHDIPLIEEVDDVPPPASLPEIKDELPNLDISCGDLVEDDNYDDDDVEIDVWSDSDHQTPPQLEFAGYHSAKVYPGRVPADYQLFPGPGKLSQLERNVLPNMEAPSLLPVVEEEHAEEDDVEDFTIHIPALMSPYRMATQELLRSSQFPPGHPYTSRYGQIPTGRPFGSNTAPSYPSNTSRFQRGFNRNRSNFTHSSGSRSYSTYNNRPGMSSMRSSHNASHNSANPPPRRNFPSHGQSEKDRRKEQNRVQRFAETQIRRVKAFQPYLDQYFKRPKPTKVGVLRASIALMEMFTSNNLEDDIMNLRSEVLSLKKKVKEKQQGSSSSSSSNPLLP